MTILKSSAISILGLSCTAVGAWLRLAARDLAWPREWSYTGPRDATLWAFREHGYQDLALLLLGFGLLIILLVLAKSLWSLPTNSKQERQE